MYPPDELDGFPYKAVCHTSSSAAAVLTERKSVDLNDGVNVAMTSGAYKIYRPSSLDSMSSNSNDGISDGEAETEDGNVAERSNWPEDSSARIGMSADEVISAMEMTHETELRRQALIENLISMGFPVDWSLRAVENNELLTEHSCITWIIGTTVKTLHNKVS
jgi:hypothetical protein